MVKSYPGLRERFGLEGGAGERAGFGAEDFFAAFGYEIVDRVAPCFRQEVADWSDESEESACSSQNFNDGG